MFVTDPNLDLVLRGLLLGAAAMLWIIGLVRILGLRSFSKMTSFDFVMTIATGSLLAGAAQSTRWTGFAQAILAVSVLFAVQFLIAKLRKSSDTAQQAIENEPVILMRKGKLLRDVLEQERVAEADVMAKLREANVLDLAKVHAVVLETTGDISVLHGDEAPHPLLLNGVRYSEPVG